MREFLKTDSKGECPLEHLLSLLDGAGNYGHHFNEYNNKLSHIRSNPRILSQKTRLSFIYSPIDEDMSSFNRETALEYITRNHFFSNNGRFYISSENSVSFANIKSNLLRIKNKDDLKQFKNIFGNNQAKARGTIKRSSKLDQILRQRPNISETLHQFRMDDSEIERLLKADLIHNLVDHNENEFNQELDYPDERNYIHNQLEVLLIINGQEIHDSMIAFDVNNKNGKSDDIKFRFVKINYDNRESRLLTSPVVIYKEILQECEDLGVEKSDSLFPFLRLKKFFSKINELLPNLLSPSTILFQTLRDTVTSHKLEIKSFQSKKISAILSRFIRDNQSSFPQ